MRILLVDDNRDFSEMFAAEIESRLNCPVDIAHNGLDAFINCQMNEYDFIITDHVMPVMNGTSLIVAIRTRDNQNKETPIIMLTGFSIEGLENIPELSDVTFINKPVSISKLLKVLKKNIYV